MTARRQACLDLLSAVGQLRAQVAGNYEYHGLEMAGRLAEVRQRAVEAELAAIAVSLLPPGSLASPAADLADAVRRLAQATQADTDLRNGAMLSGRSPDFAGLDAGVTAFRLTAMQADTSSRQRTGNRRRLAIRPGRSGG